MKDAIIIAVCAIILGGAGFGVGWVTTKDPEPSALDVKLGEKAEVHKPESLKPHNGMVYGGIGAVVGVAAGAGVSAVMGKKK